jgi:aminoglycoside phosphotransferase (APT) family kinase protein
VAHSKIGGGMNQLHEGQIIIDAAVVKKLVKTQFAEYKDLPISEFNSSGTVNSIFRLGDDYCIRLPILKQYADSLLREYNILPYLSKKLTVKIPRPVKLGSPDASYPFSWAIYTWLDGSPYDNDKITDYKHIVPELAGFITALHSVDLLDDAPKAGRAPLLALNTVTQEALNNSKAEIDYKKAVKIWETLLNTPAWDKKPVWIHADLLKSNILTKNNHIAAIIDFGSAGIGDPAFDFIAAWTLFDRKNRQLFRKLLNIDDIVWRRACAYALHQAAIGIPYYRKSNPEFVRQSIWTIEEIIMDGTA